MVLNCGSSSVKYSLFVMGATEASLASGLVERIGLDNPRLIHKLPDGQKIVREDVPVQDHRQAIRLVLETLTHPAYGVLASTDEIEAVGHRVVHGGERFAASVRIDDAVMQALYDHVGLAPLHNPPNITGIEAVRAALPDVVQVGVFDTAFHQTMPPHAHVYALPYELYEKYRIRRYGFHGTSHRFVAHEAARFLGRPLEELRLITCHLGNGASVTAVQYGRSVDTSMGFTPLEGLEMGTRCGDLDPAIVFFLMEKEGLDVVEVNELLNKKSGVLGVSGYTFDMREIEAAVYSDVRRRTLNTHHPHHRRARLALDIYNYRVKKYIGAYAAAMGGADAVVFTGGIGEHSEVTPDEACAGMEFMGIELGAETDLGNGWYELSKPTSRVRVLIVPTNEELMIARDTYRILSSLAFHMVNV
jgi:acetate kinase